jgi:hypothetical protein
VIAFDFVFVDAFRQWLHFQGVAVKLWIRHKRFPMFPVVGGHATDSL